MRIRSIWPRHPGVRAPKPPDGGDLGRLIRTTDWSGTSLGAIGTWPPPLRASVNLCVNSRYPTAIFHGPDLLALYNDAFVTVLGAKHPRVLGAPAREVWLETWDLVGPMLQGVMTGGDPTWSEDLLLPRERSGFVEEAYFTFACAPILDDGNRVLGVFAAVSETTSRVLGERRLAVLQELGARTMAAVSEQDVCARAARALENDRADVPFAAFYLTDEAGRIARLCARSGLPEGCRAAAGAIDLAASADAGCWPLHAASRGPVTVDDVRDRVGEIPAEPWPEPVRSAVVVPLARPDAPRSLGYLVVGLSPRLAFNARYAGFVEVVAEQTTAALESARAYGEGQRRVEALADLDRAKTAFFSNVSHEFRTPLTLMLGPLEQAVARGGRALSGEGLELVHRQARRVLTLVDALLDFSRAEAARERAIFRPTDLPALTQGIASTFRSVVEHAGLAFNVRCDPIGEPLYVDQELWEKIVLHLISNALKFTFEGGIDVKLAARPGGVELAVSDTGVGIPPEDLPHIFEPFHRSERLRARSDDGPGLGLTLVQDLVRLHGGTVEVRSERRAGTTVTVRLPAGAGHLPAGRVATSISTAAPDSPATALVQEAWRWLPDSDSSAPGNPAPDVETVAAVRQGPEASVRILVVDRDADMRRYLTRLLGERWSVVGAADSAAALAEVGHARPDLVLTDIGMAGADPGEDGLQLLRQLRADPATRNIPVIFLSARAGEDASVGALTAGAEDYLVKPFSARELVARVATHVELSRLRTYASREHERLLSVFRAAPAAIAVTRGPEHVFEMANDRYFQLLGRREIIGKPARDALPELADQGIWATANRVYQTGESYTASEFPASLDRTGTGEMEQGYFDFSIQPLRDATGHIDGLLTQFIEVTDSVVARHATDQARQAAEAANRAKDEFLAMLGHELRNPLAPILTALELMRRSGEKATAEQRSLIDRQVRHLMRLVEDLLDVSRIATGKVDLRRERMVLADVVLRAAETAQPLIAEREQQLSVAVPRRDLVVEGDATRLAQVVTNLLTNAAKYTDRGGRITVRARRVADRVELRVRDTGIGIEADMLPRIFDPFVQDSQARERSQGGLGVGLSIVKRLVELHGGTVEARSDGLGRGSEFVVRLPAAEPAVPAAG